MGGGPAEGGGGGGGRGSSPTLSRRRGYVGETSFPPRTRAGGERCSCELQRLRRLRGVRMIGACVHLELGDLRRRELVLGQHPLNRLADDLGGAPLELLAQRPLPDPARIAGVAVVDLLVELLTRHR